MVGDTGRLEFISGGGGGETQRPKLGRKTSRFMEL